MLWQYQYRATGCLPRHKLPTAHAVTSLFLPNRQCVCTTQLSAYADGDMLRYSPGCFGGPSTFVDCAGSVLVSMNSADSPQSAE